MTMSIKYPLLLVSLCQAYKTKDLLDNESKLLHGGAELDDYYQFLGQ